MLEIREGRHPCVARTFEGGDFIPNDTLIGIKDVSDFKVSSKVDVCLLEIAINYLLNYNVI